jgi:mRNA interferase MazF
MNIERGDIFFASLNPVVGAEQAGVRPVWVVQNDQANKFIPTVTVVPLTSNLRASRFSFTVLISATQSGLPQDSVVLAFQIRTLDKSRLIRKAGHLNVDQMAAIDRALNIHLDLR